MNRLLFEEGELDACSRVRLGDRRAEHLLRVLKVVPGGRVRAGVMDRSFGTARVVDAGPAGVLLEYAPECVPAPAPDSGVDLLLAMPRPKVMKRLWPQLASLGVGSVWIVGAARVEKCYFATHWLDPAKVRPLLVQGAEQAGDVRIPRFHVRPDLRDGVRDALEGGGYGMRWLGVPGPWGDLPPGSGDGDGPRLLAAIGPEGGWTPGEIEFFAGRRFLHVSLGNRILRSDTACVAMLGMASRFLGVGGCGV